MSDAWRTYRNTRAGYAVDYPSSWTVRERADTNGSFTTTFTPPSGGASIEVAVLSEGLNVPDISDIPNTRCERVRVGGLTGARCFDTISFSTTTTLVGKGKTYVISTSGKRGNPEVYQRFLHSFRTVP